MRRRGDGCQVGSIFSSSPQKKKENKESGQRDKIKIGRSPLDQSGEMRYLSSKNKNVRANIFVSLSLDLRLTDQTDQPPTKTKRNQTSPHIP